MWIIYKLIPIKQCKNPPDWTYYYEKEYGKYVYGTYGSKELADGILEALETGNKETDVVYYIGKE
jgi:hypothetical protein